MECPKYHKLIPDDAILCCYCGKRLGAQNRKAKKRPNGTSCIYKLGGNRAKPWGIKKNGIFLIILMAKIPMIKYISSFISSSGRSCKGLFKRLMPFRKLYIEDFLYGRLLFFKLHSFFSRGSSCHPPIHFSSYPTLQQLSKVYFKVPATLCISSSLGDLRSMTDTSAIKRSRDTCSSSATFLNMGRKLEWQPERPSIRSVGFTAT